MQAKQARVQQIRKEKEHAKQVRLADNIAKLERDINERQNIRKTQHQINEFNLTVEVVAKARKKSMIPSEKDENLKSKTIHGKKNRLAEVCSPCGSTELIKFEIEEDKLKKEFKARYEQEKKDNKNWHKTEIAKS